MPIRVPGKRSRGRRKINTGKRDPVALLSLTPMVDMFTVLVVFLLQHFVVTGTPIEIYEDITLPDAAQTKPLKPTNVITINKDRILFNNEEVMSFSDFNDQGWWIMDLSKKVKAAIESGEKETQNVANRLKTVIKKAVREDEKKDEEEETPQHLRLTVQADRDIDFLSVKKVMFTAMQSGIVEINFAVVQKPTKKEKQL